MLLHRESKLGIDEIPGYLEVRHSSPSPNTLCDTLHLAPCNLHLAPGNLDPSSSTRGGRIRIQNTSDESGAVCHACLVWTAAILGHFRVRCRESRLGVEVHGPWENRYPTEVFPHESLKIFRWVYGARSDWFTMGLALPSKHGYRPNPI